MKVDGTGGIAGAIEPRTGVLARRDLVGSHHSLEAKQSP